MPRVILIVLDSLRTDYLSVYNKKAFPSKNLEMLAQDSLVFEQCIAPSSWTLPSHASLFTGFYVSEHKCEFLISSLPILSENFKTLAEIFRDKGYKTAAVISNFGWLAPKFNVNQGFQIYNCIRTIGIQQSFAFRPLISAFSYITNIYPKSILATRSADDINREAIAIMTKMKNEPFFFFLNYMEPHTPYLPLRPYDNIFLKAKSTQFFRLKQYFLRYMGNHDKITWDSYLQSQYIESIASLDSELGKLFTYLKQTGIYDSSLIIVTADHGELLGEHGLYEHHDKLYEGVAKIPLIIKFPFSEKIGREQNYINLTDVFSTILSICNIPIPSNVSGKAYGGELSSVAELFSFFLGDHKVIYDGKYKYMEYENIEGNKGPEKTFPELYNLKDDPFEKENLAEKHPEIARAMHIKLNNWKNKRKQNLTEPVEAEPLPEEIKDGLRALGYVQ